MHFSASDFRRTFLKFLRYNPINEFGFFYESIGIDYLDVPRFLKANVHFFSDDSSVLDAACALAGFGFPWDKLGILYVEKFSIFGKEPGFLSARLNGLLAIGFSNQQVVGICLAFPLLLDVELGSSGEIDALVDDLQRVFVDFDLGSQVEGNVDVWYEVSRKIKVFYDLGVDKGKVGEVMDRSKTVFIDYPEKDFVEKVEFFCRLGVNKTDVGFLLLRYPGILSIKFDDRVISVLGVLNHFGVQSKKLKKVMHRYPYVFGRNKMVHLPHILRALDLHEWFFNRIKCGYYHLWETYDLSSPDEGADVSYLRNLEKVKSSIRSDYATSKLQFFHWIGFGENKFTVKLLTTVHGSASDLQERFDFLLNEGIEFSKICKMIICSPKVLNQEIPSLRQKMDYFREEMGLSLEHLEGFPAYLMYNLEKRIKPRYRFHVWLTERGWCKKKYSLSSIIAISEKGFLAQLSCIHPAAPLLWLEQSSKRKQIHENSGD